MAGQYGFHGDFGASQREELLRMMEEARRTHKPSGRAGDNAKDLNARIDPPPFQGLSEKLTIREADLRDHLPGHYHVVMPRRGRLGDTRLCGQNGKPIAISPLDTPEWRDPNKAMAHFAGVARQFDILNGLGELYDAAK